MMNLSYKFAVIGDSFALPRMYTHKTNTVDDITNSKGIIEITGREVYPEILKDNLEDSFKKIAFSFINLSSHANTSYNTFNYNCLDLYMEQPDFLILQIGLVDCWNRKGINWGPFPHMAGKDPWVSIEEYEKNITKIIKFSFDICKTIKYIFIVNIPLVRKEQYEKHPDSYERTIEYNKIINKLVKENKNVNCVDIFSEFQKNNAEEFETLFCHDNTHYNRKGNKIVAELIYGKVADIISYCEGERLYHENNIEEALNYIQGIDKNQLTEDYQRKVERLERICLKKVESN